MIDRILIIALNENWTGISRLPFGLDRAGFKTFALCPNKSFLAKTKFLAGSILYPTFSYSRSKLIYLWMVIAFVLTRPDFVIPGDEDALLALQNLAANLSGLPILGNISLLIRKSLTPKEHNNLLLSKSIFQEKSRDWGLRAPKNIIVDDLESAVIASEKIGFPLVIKFDAGYGGSGVFICQNIDEMKAQFNSIQKNPGPSLKDKLKKALFISIFINDNKISLQEYIEGMVGQAPFCSLNGKVFAMNSMYKLMTYPGKTGPTSVAQGMQNIDIENFVKTVCQKMNYSGFGSLEYIVESKTNLLYVIELNPRPTPTCHLGEDVVTYDLCKMFYNGLNGLPIIRRDFKPYTVAIFPNEKRRDPQSEYLNSGYYDVPQDDPELFKALTLS